MPSCGMLTANMGNCSRFEPSEPRCDQSATPRKKSASAPRSGCASGKPNIGRFEADRAAAIPGWFASIHFETTSHPDVPGRVPSSRASASSFGLPFSYPSATSASRYAGHAASSGLATFGSDSLNFCTASKEMITGRVAR